MNRDDALALLHEHTKTVSLRNHALAVEGVMRSFAKEAGEDEELWGLTGLLHDFDYEENPQAPDHPTVGCRILEEKGYPSEMIEAIKGHAEYMNVPRETALAKTLFAVDELTGLVVAVTLVRPSKSIVDVKVKSVKKKIKDKAFARSVNRDDIRKGAEELEMELGDVIEKVIKALHEVADQIGIGR